MDEQLEPTVEQFDEETGEQTVKELSKEYLTKGAWQTMMFLYAERDFNGEFSDPKVSIRRYQKVKGAFRQRSKFNVSNKAQAEKIVEILRKWYDLQ